MVHSSGADGLSALGVIPFLHDVISLLPKTQGLRVRADAGFYEKDFVGELDGKGIEFAIVARMTQPIKNRVAGIKYHAINRSFSTSEFSYQRHGWKRSNRFVVLRRKVEDDPEEKLTLFTLAKYDFRDPHLPQKATGQSVQKRPRL